MGGVIPHLRTCQRTPVLRKCGDVTAGEVFAGMGKILLDLTCCCQLTYIAYVGRGELKTEEFWLKATHSKMSRSSILPDEEHFSDFRGQCLATDNWVKKYDSEGMTVWVEIPPKKKAKSGPKVHKIKVGL